MKTVCEIDQCVGCMACVVTCHKQAIKIEDSLLSYNAVIDTKKCVDCKKCEKVCQKYNLIEKKTPIRWYQGWSNDDEIRKTSSSGGFATAIMKSFIEMGGSVCSCFYKEGEFVFKITDSIEEIGIFTGSKYVKSNPVSAYEPIKKKLREGEKVLFLGLPCQVAGIKNYIGKELENKLYTVDLICHGTPSPMILDKFFSDKGIKLSTIKDLKFRVNSRFNLYNEYKSITPPGIVDSYTYSFLKQVNYTENCYNCAYAKIERISDVTLGDSWGSDLKSEISSGVSLALCQTEKGLELLQKANIFITGVDIENAIENNSQLKHSAIRSKQRDKFFRLIKSGISYDRAMFFCFPKVFLRQKIKNILMKTKLISGGGQIIYSIRYLSK